VHRRPLRLRPNKIRMKSRTLSNFRFWIQFNRRLIPRVSLFLLWILLSAQPVLAQESQVFEVVIPQNFYKFVPDKVTIHTGDQVKWINNDERTHVLASVPGSGPTDDLEIFSDEFRPGTAYIHKFMDPGEYPYFCFIHNKMVGSIIVLGKGK